MHAAEIVLAALGDLGEGPVEIKSPAEWLLGRGPVPETEIAIAGASMSAHFPTPPTAAGLASALVDLDREARRTAAAIKRRIPPVELFGRGRRLQPLRDGLLVEQATPGSLDVMLALGGLYTLVTSQPVSFMLNLASLAGYCNVVVRAHTPNGRARTRELHVARTEPPPSAAGHDGPMRIPTPHGDVVVPSSFTYIKLHARGADGSVIDVEAES